jgi:DNA repair exonuclease SbcCD nuclease subunit
LILAVGDIHASGKNPAERKDDLTTVQWDKIKYIVEIANYHDVPIICTGDVFETPLVSNRMMSRMGEMLNKLHNPFYFVFGNHDLQYHNLDMLDQTSLGAMWLNNQKLKHISEFEGDYGRAWSYIDWRSPFHDPDAKYLLAHRAIVNDNLISANSWVMDDKDFCQHVKELSRYELIICGHWHKSYEYFYQSTKENVTHVLNPGVVCRRTIVERENPSVFFMDLDSSDYSTRIDLSARPADDVLREESLKTSITPHKEEITKFIEQLRNHQLSQKVCFIDNLMSIVDKMEEQPAVDREIRNLIATVQQKKKGAIA